MDPAIPQYYTSLRPFRRLFESGWPILTYHGLGPLPGRVRIKGLHLSARLFQRQLRELRQAGFSGTDLDHLAKSPERPPSSSVILTFDDGLTCVHQWGMEPLAAHGFHAIQFLVSGLIGKTNAWQGTEGDTEQSLMDEGRIREWLAAGHAIGAHTITHPWLTRLSTERAREEIQASRKSLEDRFGVAVHHFCYPYGDWNPTVRGLVTEAGYTTACTTDFGVNSDGSNPLALRRVTARYRSRKLKNLVAWLRG